VAIPSSVVLAHLTPFSGAQEKYFDNLGQKIKNVQ
jgi:hypothetical protein